MIRRVWENFRYHPFEVVIFILLFFYSLGLLTGHSNNPKSIDVTFVPWLRRLWGIELIVGSLSSFVGLIFALVRFYVLGMVCIAAVAAFYLVAILYLHPPGYPVLGITYIALIFAAITRADDEWDRR